MGIPVVTVGKQHVCPMKDGSKPHKGGQVTKGISGVFIDGMPVATVGSTCVCCSPKTNSITSGAYGILVDGKPIAVLGSQTEHGGNVIEGNPGVTVSGGFATKSDQPEDFEPQIFNLRWMKGDHLIKSDTMDEVVTFKASTVGFEDGDMVDRKIYNEDGDLIIDKQAEVQRGEVSIEFETKDGHFKEKGEEANE